MPTGRRRLLAGLLAPLNRSTKAPTDASATPSARVAVARVAARGRVYRPQGWLSPVLLIDSRMAGAGGTSGRAAG